ncbi:Protein of unknown function [Gryllus bimaculatus]|nr:Protein of unknown function [Gryllus bimaculatus]
MVSMEASRNQEADAVAYEIRIGRLLISELNNKDEELKRFRRPKRSRSLWVVANAGNSNSGGGGINSDGSGGGNSSCERTAGLLKDALRSVHLLAANCNIRLEERIDGNPTKIFEQLEIED